MPSHHNKHAFEKVFHCAIHRIPHTFHFGDELLKIEEMRQRLELDKDCFLFYTIASWQDRKNLEQTVNSFSEAFEEEERARLVIKTSFGPYSPIRCEDALDLKFMRKGQAGALASRVTIESKPWSRAAIATLHRVGSCYVSLHSGEGWGYPLFESVCSGNNVVATRYGGPLDYLQGNLHALVQFEMVPVQQNYRQFGADMVWAMPDFKDAVVRLRSVFHNAVSKSPQALDYGSQLKHDHSLQVIGGMFASLFDLLWK